MARVSRDVTNPDPARIQEAAKSQRRVIEERVERSSFNVKNLRGGKDATALTTTFAPWM